MNDTSHHAKLKELADNYLLNNKVEAINDVINGVFYEAKKGGITFDKNDDVRYLVEYLWELARIGIVAFGANTTGIFHEFTIPHFIVTLRGRQFLERGELSPHNPERYLCAVKSQIKSPDSTAIDYLNEAVGCWYNQLYRASTVMLGVACERLVLILAEAISKSNCVPWNAQLSKSLGKKYSNISDLFEKIRQCLMHLKGDKKLSESVADALDRRLGAIFDHARGIRNEHGHPTGSEVMAEDAEAGLLLFPGFYKLVEDTINDISRI